MIGTIIFVYLLYKFLNNPQDKRNSDIFKLIITCTVGLAILSAIIGIFASGGLGGFAVLCLIAYWIYKKKQENMTAEQKEKYGSVEGVANTIYEEFNKRTGNSDPYAHRAPSKGKLPGTVAGRRRQIQDFNEKYDLYLTEDQIDSMVNSSFLSNNWKREIQDMGVKYDTIHQWFTGPTAWLRIYIHAFISQEITSDFAMQEQIAIHSFEEVFAYVEKLGRIPMQEKIDKVNEKFFAQFDDITFMAAYRYLESKGFKHSMDVAQPMHTGSTMEDLERKYENMEV